MTLRLLAASTLLALAAPVFAAAVPGNVAAGQEKSKTCASCHGPTGNESLDDTYPKLAGQHPDYLVHSLRQYRSGERNNAIMAGFAATLSDEDINDLAAFYGSQDGALRDLSDIDAR